MFVYPKREGYSNNRSAVQGGKGRRGLLLSYLANAAGWLKAAACCSQLRVFKALSVHPCLGSSHPSEGGGRLLPAQNKTCPTAPALRPPLFSQAACAQVSTPLDGMGLRCKRSLPKDILGEWRGTGAD